MEKQVEKAIHLTLWLVFGGLQYSNAGRITRVYTNAEGDQINSVSYDSTMLIVLAIDLVAKIILFYGNVYFLGPKSKNDASAPYSLLVRRTLLFIGTLIFAGLINYFILYKASTSFNSRDLAYDYTLPYSLVFHFLIFLLSIGYSSMIQSKENEQLKERLQQENLSTELKFLKAQIHPHFFFNTLNNIYGIVRKHEQPEAAKSIAQLSRIMRYMIYESNADRVFLKRELEHIKDFIQLQKLRLKDPGIIETHLHLLEKQNEKRIAPMLLMPFVENAFKFGISNSQPSKILIKASMPLKDQFNFQVINTKHKRNQHQDQLEGGVGLANVKRRIELLYPKQHQLLIEDDLEYRVTLKIQLNG